MTPKAEAKKLQTYLRRVRRAARRRFRKAMALQMKERKAYVEHSQRWRNLRLIE